MGFSFNPLKAVSSLLGDPFGFDAQDDANKANEQRYQLALKLFDENMPRIKAAFEKQQGTLGQAGQEVRTGYGRALGEIGTMGQRGRQSARDIGASTTGRQSSILQNRGLGTSTRLAGLARGVASDTQRNVQAVNESVAGARSGLMAAQGDRLANLQTLLGNSFVNQNQALNQWRQSKINTIASREDVAGPGWLTTLGNVAGGFGGLLGGL